RLLPRLPARKQKVRPSGRWRVWQATGAGQFHAMDDRRGHHAASQVRWATAQAAEPRSRTRRRIAAILIGAAIGYAIGGAFVLLFDRARYSGDSSNLVVGLVGLP